MLHNLTWVEVGTVRGLDPRMLSGAIDIIVMGGTSCGTWTDVLHSTGGHGCRIGSRCVLEHKVPAVVLVHVG